MRTLYHPNREDIRLSTVLYALSDPIRLKIILNLKESNEKSCSSFDFQIAKSTLSHHFKILRESGIIHTRMEGTQRFISLRQEDLDLLFPGLLHAILQSNGPI